MVLFSAVMPSWSREFLLTAWMASQVTGAPTPSATAAVGRVIRAGVPVGHLQMCLPSRKPKDLHFWLGFRGSKWELESDSTTFQVEVGDAMNQLPKSDCADEPCLLFSPRHGGSGKLLQPSTVHREFCSFTLELSPIWWGGGGSHQGLAVGWRGLDWGLSVRVANYFLL